MTTTDFIKLLTENEFGGATGRPREVMFEVDDEIFETDGVEVTGSGDGLFAELFLSLPSAKRKTGKWEIKKASIHPYGNDVCCSECGHTLGSSFGYKFCPMCGCKMEAEE